MEKIKLKSLEKTCFACPSQWEGQLENGEYVYIRYRWGSLSFGSGDTIDEAIDNSQYVKSIGDEMDGVLSTEDMLNELGLEL